MGIKGDAIFKSAAGTNGNGGKKGKPEISVDTVPARDPKDDVRVASSYLCCYI